MSYFDENLNLNMTALHSRFPISPTIDLEHKSAKMTGNRGFLYCPSWTVESCDNGRWGNGLTQQKLSENTKNDFGEWQKKIVIKISRVQRAYKIMNSVVREIWKHRDSTSCSYGSSTRSRKTILYKPSAFDVSWSSWSLTSQLLID